MIRFKFETPGMYSTEQPDRINSIESLFWIFIEDPETRQFLILKWLKNAIPKFNLLQVTPKPSNWILSVACDTWNIFSFSVVNCCGFKFDGRNWQEKKVFDWMNSIRLFHAAWIIASSKRILYSIKNSVLFY